MATVDSVLDLLSEKRRRYALYYLDEQDSPVHIDELAEEIADMEAMTDGGAVVHDDLEKYEVQLLHETLPKASEAEYIEYDREEGVVQLTHEPPKFEGLLTVAKVLERPR